MSMDDRQLFGAEAEAFIKECHVSGLEQRCQLYEKTINHLIEKVNYLKAYIRTMYKLQDANVAKVKKLTEELEQLEKEFLNIK